MFVKTQVDELSEMFAEVAVQLRRIVLRNEEQRPHRMQVWVGRLAFCQLYRRNTKTPYIHLKHTHRHSNCILYTTLIQGLGNAGLGKSADPLKFGAEVRFWIWYCCQTGIIIIFKQFFVLCLCKYIYHLHLGPFPHVYNQHDFKGCGENRRFMLHDKTWF